IDYLDAWKQYLKWETSNPLNLSDSAALCRRVIYAYSQACIALRFYPEIWIEFAEYLSSLEQHSEALAKLRSASQVLPSSLAVQFAYAEMAEKHKQPDVSKQVYEQIVTLARSEIDSTTERSKHKLEKFDKRLELIDSKMAATESRKEMQETEVDEQAATAAAAEELAASFDSESDDIDDSDMSDDASQASTAGPSGATALFERAKRRVDARVAGTKARMERELVEKREIYTLAWIMYMRFVQRAEGIDAVRQLLRRPRADPSGYVTHHLFVAAALMEYHVAKKPGIAAKLFEFYSKMHSDQSAYIFEYLSYLINSGDDTNARALFERFQGTSTGDSGDMWSMFADF
ncbi:mRNA 3'-end-processing protein rna14, partial [Coemansia sp. RSA 2320]